MNIIGLFYVFIYQIYTFTLYRNSLTNFIIYTMYFLTTWFWSIIMVFILFVHYLYDIKIEEINVNDSVMVLFNKKNNYWHILRIHFQMYTFTFYYRNTVKNWIIEMVFEY
eukprot:107853_1